MTFRTRFDCLWCGSPWTARAPADLEGWAQLCPACLGKAGSSRFLRDRVRAAIADRSAAGAPPPVLRAAPSSGASAPAPPSGPATPAWSPAPPPALEPRRTDRRPTDAGATFPDDWFLRRGAFERGPLHDAAWAAEIDAVTRWLDGRPIAGRILEPAAGNGFFSPLLAERGELHASDPDGAALDVARVRLVAHGLLAHLHVADPWALPAGDTPPADALVAAFLLGRVRRAGLDGAIGSFRERLTTGGTLAVVELLPDPAGGPPPGVPWTWHDPLAVEAALSRAGFADIEIGATGRFFATVSATAA
jgi:SAM-dependent methyltransferase